MAIARITPKDLERMTDKIQDDLAAVAEERMQGFVQLQRARTERLSKVHARLMASLGSAHPRVKALAIAAEAAERQGEILRTAAARQTRKPKINPHEWMVFGRVRSPQGQPMQGLRVRVFDRDRKFDDLLGEAYTDEFGDFAAVYHERDFAEVREGLPELYVLVEDAAGKLLFSSRDGLRFQAGRAEYFEIDLGADEPADSDIGQERPPPSSVGGKRKESK